MKKAIVTLAILGLTLWVILTAKIAVIVGMVLGLILAVILTAIAGYCTYVLLTWGVAKEWKAKAYRNILPFALYAAVAFGVSIGCGCTTVWVWQGLAEQFDHYTLTVMQR
jgi:hypothetical protein